MLAQIVIGSIVTLVTILMAAGLGGVTIAALDLQKDWLVRRPHAPKLVMTLLVALGVILLSNLISVMAWAGLFLAVRAFPDVETAIYFALVTVTTLGFGDILMIKPWRLLAGFAAANGLLLFGFYTAFIVEILRRIHHIQHAIFDEQQVS